MRTTVTVSAIVKIPVKAAWSIWNDQKHIAQWYTASDDWHTPRAENDLRSGGWFLYCMKAKDGSAGLDFRGEYTSITMHKRIAYRITDGRTVSVDFTDNGNQTTVSETFETENVHTVEEQRAGWQAILDNFSRYAEQVQPA